MVADVINWHWGPLHHKREIQNYQNKDRLSVYRIRLPQRKPKLGRTKPSTGPHAARELDIAVPELFRELECSKLSINYSSSCILIVWNKSFSFKARFFHELLFASGLDYRTEAKQRN